MIGRTNGLAPRAVLRQEGTVVRRVAMVAPRRKVVTEAHQGEGMEVLRERDMVDRVDLGADRSREARIHRRVGRRRVGMGVRRRRRDTEMKIDWCTWFIPQENGDCSVCLAVFIIAGMGTMKMVALS